jgi:tryptophan synthase alpha chain
VDRLERALRAPRDQNRLSLVPFLTAGYPDPTTSLELLRAIDDAGVEAIELGIPFSDPLADGPTIQRTTQIALERGMTVAGVLELVARFRTTSDTPLVVMTYTNPILRFGADRFAAAAVAAGIEGILMTDLPPDELPEVWSAFGDAGLGRVQLVAPTTDPERVARVARAASGFVYCVSRTGVTGRGRGFAANLAEQIRRVRAATDLPVLVGFGVRRPEDVTAAGRHADGVVVGAAVLERVLEADAIPDGISHAARLVRELSPALTRGGRA